MKEAKKPFYMCKQGKTFMNERYYTRTNDDELTQRGYQIDNKADFVYEFNVYDKYMRKKHEEKKEIDEDNRVVGSLK